MSGIKKLTAIVFVLAMTSTVCAYAGGGSDTSACFAKHNEILKKVKTCIGIEDVRIIQTKSFNMMLKWAKAESRNNDRDVTQSHDVTTKNQVTKIGGVFLGVSLPKGKNSAFDIFKKIENCLKTEDARIIETKDEKIIKAWMKEEMKKEITEERPLTMELNRETGVFTATSIKQ